MILNLLIILLGSNLSLHAYFVYKRREMSVIKTKIILNKNKYFNIEPGRVVLYQVNPIVKYYDGL